MEQHLLHFQLVFLVPSIYRDCTVSRQLGFNFNRTRQSEQ